MAAAGVQTARTVLGLHSDSARTQLGLILDSNLGFLFFGKGLRTVLGLSSDSTRTARTPLGLCGLLGLSLESLQIGGCRVKYWKGEDCTLAFIVWH